MAYLPSIASSQTVSALTWTASSTTAEAITGNITLRGLSLGLAGKTLRLSLAKRLTGIEAANAASLVSVPSTGRVVAAIYRTEIAANLKLLNGNTLCGKNQHASWIMLLLSPGLQAHQESLSLAVFSRTKTPNLDPARIADTTTLCGTFAYVSNAASQLPK